MSNSTRLFVSAGCFQDFLSHALVRQFDFADVQFASSFLKLAAQLPIFAWRAPLAACDSDI